MNPQMASDWPQIHRFTLRQRGGGDDLTLRATEPREQQHISTFLHLHHDGGMSHGSGVVTRLLLVLVKSDW